ncbi:transporter substrate-binding domain-containing protein [Rhodobacteraceae bacterium]|nr:transporter substrate-binding domain-containing protein [Paracoccaceae bacterium]
MMRAFAILMAFLTFGSSLAAQDLRVVTVSRTPFSFVENDVDTGFSIELWAAVAEDLGFSYSINRVQSFRDMLVNVETDQADIAIANISITADRETRMDFSQPIFASGLRIMVPAGQSGVSTLSVLWTRDIGLLAIAALALLLGAGMLMWRFERNAQEYFKGNAREKLFPSFWWALNLVVNGGFEERAPRTPLGRIFATLLVISSLFIVSIFVANITAAITVGAIQSNVNSVNDLYGKRVGTTSGSTAAAYLEQRELIFRGFDDLALLLQSFENGDLDAVIFDAPILSYYVNTSGAGIGELKGPMFLRESYGFALQSGSPLREPINRTLLRFAEDGTYNALLTKWFGMDVAR